ncbi:galactosylceramide sulfotransferase-like [Lingula anatina]|uniref:Galactosylceramide sulfotransferase-like n=1 Tax=Lingula anatina TaxID=7574 RepID=A0A1S3HXG2_LINAN|nr:galactosylceramide sulfotransferase-like [Lingula anatina]|eukprot:XP_013390722.1 galactosylceramide sulfotransferase-like [Lingula anatina]
MILVTENSDIGKAVTNLVFLKTQKVAGSTVQNILMRFGYARDLVFMLGAKKNLYKVGQFPDLFSPSFILRSASGLFNILCHHTRFSQDIKKVMPSNSIYFTILRDPISTFESLFSFLDISEILGFKDSDGIERFFEMPEIYNNILNVSVSLKNTFLADFGLDITLSDNFSAIYEKILEIEENFDFVMITEYFDESLVLLKHLLNWSFADIVSVRSNARPKRQHVRLTLDNIAKINKWNAGDRILYDHFNRTFWRKAEQFGLVRLSEEVEQLRKLNTYWDRVCFDKNKVLELKRRIPGHPTTDREVTLPKLSKAGSKIEKCVQMSLFSQDFTDIIYASMREKGQLLDERSPKKHFLRTITERPRE